MHARHCGHGFLVLVSLALGHTAGTAQAPATLREPIPAQPVAEALSVFSQQTGLQVVYMARIADGVRSSAIPGGLSTDESLRKLLETTGLQFEFLNSRTVTITADVDTTDASAVGSATDSLTSGRSGRWFSRIRLAQADTAQPDPPAQASSSSTDSKAAPALEEIVVTAEKRAESIQDLPLAISAFSGDMLTDRGIANIEGLQELAPSLAVGNLARGFGTTVTIRGISGAAAEPGVGITQDGVPYFSRMLAAVDLFDIERVEVLRGPQGTMSGRNTTGGALHFHSKRPTEDFEGSLKATIGNYERLAIEGHLSGPIVQDRLLGRLAVRSDQADGWVTNTLRNETLGDIDQLQARASLLGHFTDHLEAHLILDVLRDRSSTVSVNAGRLRPEIPTLPELFGIPAFDRDRRTLQQDLPAGVDFEKYQATLKLAWDLGNWWPSASLATTTGYAEMDVSASQDHNDATAVPVIVLDPLVQMLSQVTQEVTLTMDLTDRLDVIVGGLYLRGHQPQTVFVEQLVGVSGSAFVTAPSQDIYIDRDLTSWAGYTQWRYRLTDDIRLTAGVRYTHDQKEDFTHVTLLATGLEVPSTRKGSWNAWTPRFAVDYAPTEDLTLYGSVSRGFTSGGFSFGNTSFEPEIVWNYEAGVKANWLEGRLKTALTGFYMDYTDLQLVVFGVADPTIDVLGRAVTNADAPIYGVELELDALMTERFRVTLGATWLDATFDGLLSRDSLFPELGEPGPTGSNVRDLSGNRLPRAPEWGFNVSGEYRTPVPVLGSDLQGVLRASYFWRDKEYLEGVFNHESLSQGAYGLLNLSAAVEAGDGKWDLSAYVHNLTDQFYRTHSQSPLAGPPILGGVLFSSFRLGPPRTYGVSLTYRF